MVKEEQRKVTENTGVGDPKAFQVLQTLVTKLKD
jgi:hypothetical protein